MSQENVEIVLEGFRRFDRGDMEGVRELYAPEARIVAPAEWPEQGPFEGRAAVMGQFERLRADAAESRFDLEVLATQGDWVVVAFRWHIRGEKSGVETAMDAAAAFHVVDGRVTEARYTREPAQALKAAGLGE